MAIQHHADRAANERTFLAWVRTAIAGKCNWPATAFRDRMAGRIVTGA